MIYFEGTENDSYLGIEEESYTACGKYGNFWIQKEYHNTEESSPICCYVYVNVSEDLYDDADDAEEAMDNACAALVNYANKVKANNKIDNVELCEEVSFCNDNDCISVCIYTDEADTETIFDAFCNYFGEDEQ